MPSDSLLTHDKASLLLVTNEKKRGIVTLLQSTEQVVELAEIAADARDFVAASRAENTTRVYRVYASEWGELALILGGTPENSVVGRARK